MPSLPVPYGGAFIIVSLFDGVLPFHVPLWRGPGGGFGLLGEQSLQQPPPAEEDRDTSTSSATFELEPFAFVLDPCIMSLSGGASFSCRLWRGLHYCPPLEGGLCHNAEWSLRDASQASWQSRVFGYLGDCFSRCCSFAMTLRHSLRGPGGGFGLLGEQSLQQPPPAEEDRDTSTSSATFELEPFAFVLDPCIMSLSGGGQGEVTTTTSAGRG